MNPKARKAVSALLLCFVLVSIGYAIGKEVTQRKLAAQRLAAGPGAGAVSGEKVIVYYMHPTLRCVTCNAIEKAARGTVEEDFAREVRTGRLEWRTVNFDEDEALAKRYDVASSSVILVRLRDGKEVAHERLDKVWELSEWPKKLRAYLRKAVRAYVEGKAGPS